ncbi:DUF2066 domain-containing protein [Mesorhizobium sp. KR1-2]|uniref:DUF2066 domain-containing protein n=1 Tax=Mesorhizobium sp. KR1-2 TaxID=3156609 RepID=UPI0032B50303
MLRSSGLACLVALLAPAATGCGAAADELYQAKAVVSGQGEERRALGFALCLKDVVAKVSGDARLTDDPRMAEPASKAASFVTGFSYRDRLSGKPLHDEQGSYDRPHDLTCDFDRHRIDALLETLGHRPWPEPRPRILLLVDIKDRQGKAFMLANDSADARDQDMSGALAAASERFALLFRLPAQALLAKAVVDEMVQGKADPADLERVANAAGAEKVVAGTLLWSDQALGWVSEWRLSVQGKSYRWQARGVGFDDAFRNVVSGAAQILSGNGQPADIVK